MSIRKCGALVPVFIAYILISTSEGFAPSDRPQFDYQCIYRRAQQEGSAEFVVDPPGAKGSRADIPDDVPDNVSSKIIEETINNERTLYEILNVAPTATRADIKKQYVQLAKISHPDAQITKQKTNKKDDGAIVPDFNEIAAAWRVLGDPKSRKRYDRDLRAKAFSESASRFAYDRLEKAVPAVAEMMDKVAVPFLRRTTATTIAVGRAVAEGVSQTLTTPAENSTNSTKSLSDAFVGAIEAGQRAGRVIDTIELNEKSDELRER